MKINSDQFNLLLENFGQVHRLAAKDRHEQDTQLNRIEQAHQERGELLGKGLNAIADRLAAIEQICQQTQDEQVGFAGRLPAIEQGQAELRKACDNYTECVLTPMLASLENRLMEAHNNYCVLCERLDARNEMLGAMASDMKLIFELLAERRPKPKSRRKRP